MRLRAGNRLAVDQGGVAALEFALVAPVFLILVMGMLNVGQMAYGTAVLNGAVQSAGRKSAFEGASTTAADDSVRNAIGRVLPGVQVTSSRKSYVDFSDLGRPEKFNDKNADGNCNTGEAYTDENGSGSWDSDVGKAGNGGASDVVVYTVRATYSPIFKVPFAPTSWSSKTLTATSVKKNQPFMRQSSYKSTAGTCS